MKDTTWHHKRKPPAIGWWPASAGFNREAIRWWNGHHWSVVAYSWKRYTATELNRIARTPASTNMGTQVGQIRWTRRWWLIPGRLA